jgi:MarR family transcriptional regulator, lower aerobic nicotinate degradation pathway regulator
LQSEEQNLGYLLNKATLGIKWELSCRLKNFDLTVPQWSVLRDLYVQEMLPAEERKVTPADTAGRLLVDRPTISGIVDRLCKKQLICTEPNPLDRRSQLLMLTDDAKRLMPMLESKSQAALEQACKGMTEGEIQDLKKLLDRVIHNLKNDRLEG